MSFLTLLSLEDEQIELVTDAVRRWCEQKGCDIGDEHGRLAMETAVAVALSARTPPASLLEVLTERIG
jgi:hypothetical protein